MQLFPFVFVNSLIPHNEATMCKKDFTISLKSEADMYSKLQYLENMAGLLSKIFYLTAAFFTKV